jgi:uncharacterized RmlC-like cupin family protein
MSTSPSAAPSCVLVTPGPTDTWKNRLAYARGISAESAGAKALCMHLVTIPPGARSAPHVHAHHETAVYVLSGEAGMEFGGGLRERMTIRAGQFVYIPANMPHVTYNRSASEPCTAVIARTDPKDEESVEPYDPA